MKPKLPKIKGEIEEAVMWVLFIIAFIFCFIVFNTPIMRAAMYIFVTMIASEQLTDWLHGK
jgi:uncharacterized MAPEG superfamily protein